MHNYENRYSTIILRSLFVGAVLLLAVFSVFLYSTFANKVTEARSDVPPHQVGDPEMEAVFFESGGAGRLDSLQIRPTNSDAWDDEIAWGCRGDHIYLFDAGRSNINRADGPDIVVFSRNPRIGCSERLITVDLEIPPYYGSGQNILHASHRKSSGPGETFLIRVDNSNLLFNALEEQQQDPPDTSEACTRGYEMRVTDQEIIYPHGGIVIPSGSDHLAIIRNCPNSNEEVFWFTGFRPSSNQATFGLTGGVTEYVVLRSDLQYAIKSNQQYGPLSDIPVAQDFFNSVDDEFGQPVASGSENETGEQCVNEGGLFGFLACQLLVWTLDGIVHVQNLLVEFLFRTEPLTIGATDDPLYQTWSNVRDVANVLLVVAFMAVVFSLALSLNVDAYTVKRMVPRLLVAAVSIQLSYFISAIFIDMTNVLGAGLQSLTDLAMSDVRAEFGAGQGAGGFLAIGALVAMLLAGGILLAPSVGLVILLMLLVLLGAFLIVALRDLLIMMAVILSPFAFLANLLPNTERWFKFWWSNFARLLLMYPFIILMIQIGNIGAYLTISTTRGSGVETFLSPLMALIMQLAAILSIYFAFRVGGTILSVATQGLSKYARGGGGGGGGGGKGGPPKGLRGKIRARAGERKAEYAAGTRGNRLSRALTAPISRTTKGTRAQATLAMEQQTAEAAKTLEAQGLTDANSLAEFAAHGSSSLNIRNRARELRTRTPDMSDSDYQSNLSTANQLEKFIPHAGKVSFRAAALKTAAGQPFVGDSINDAFSNMNETLSTNPMFRDKLQTDAAVAANKANRPDLWGKYGPGQDPTRATKAMNRQKFREIAPASLDDTQFRNALRNAVAQPGPVRSNLAGALSDYDGVGEAVHSKYRRALGDDLYQQLVDEGNSMPPPTQGNGGQQPPNQGDQGGDGS